MQKSRHEECQTQRNDEIKHNSNVGRSSSIPHIITPRIRNLDFHLFIQTHLLDPSNSHFSHGKAITKLKEESPKAGFQVAVFDRSQEDPLVVDS